MPNYTAKVIEQLHNPGAWSSYRIGIFDEDLQIGEYVRNYSFLSTFFPFTLDGIQWYALYSPDYTCTRLMSLPDCKDIGGEEPDSWGFCPVEFYVPSYSEKLYKERMIYFTDPDDGSPIKHFPFGFVAGCVWGDDSSWKIEYLDLSTPGKIVREARWGYVELPAKMSLKDAISVHRYGDRISLRIASEQEYDIDGGT